MAFFDDLNKNTVKPSTSSKSSGGFFSNLSVQKEVQTVTPQKNEVITVKPKTLGTLDELKSKFAGQQISTKENAGKLNLTETIDKFKGQEITAPRVFEGPKPETKIKSNEYKLKQFMSGKADYVIDPVTGKGDFKSPEIEAFEKAPDSAKSYLLEEQALESPLMKWLQSDRGEAITGDMVEKTSNLPLKLWANIQSVGSLGQKSFTDSYEKLLEARNDPDNTMLQKILYSAQDSIPQTLVGVGLGLIPMAGPTLATGFFASLSAEEERQKGFSSASLKNMAVDTIGDRLLGGMLDKFLVIPTRLIKSSILNMLKGSSVEGGTEVAQTFMKFANDYQAATTPEKKQQILANAKNYVTSGDMAIEFITGSLAGGVVAGGTSIVNVSIQNQNKIAEQTVERHIAEAKDVVNETPEFVEQNKTEFINNVKTNIVDGLRQEGLTAQSEKVAQIDTTKIDSVDSLQKETISSIEGIKTEVPQTQVQPKKLQTVEPTIIGDKLPTAVEPTLTTGPKVEPVTTKISEPEQALFEEARKYPTVEEFIKSQGTEQTVDIKLKEGEKFVINRNNGDISISDKQNTSRVVGSLNDINPKTASDYIRAYYNFKDIGDGIKPGNFQAAETKYEKLREKVIKEIIEIRTKEPTTLVSKKTKEELTDIWNKAQEITQPIKKAPESMPTGTPETKPKVDTKLQSRVYDRLKAEQPDVLKEDVTYTEVNLKNETEKAADLIEKDKQNAYEIAMGIESSSELLSTSANIALAVKALEEGNLTLYNTLIKNRSFAQTRRGQEIVAEKGSVTDNSVDYFVKEIINSRLANLDKDYTRGIKTADTLKKSSPQKRGLEKIKKEVDKAKKALESTKELDLAEAQSIIDSLACA